MEEDRDSAVEPSPEKKESGAGRDSGISFKKEESGTCCHLLRVRVSHERVSKAIEEAYARLGRSVVVPGFRKGKAPRAVLKHRFADKVKENVLRDLLPEAYGQAIRDAGLKPIALPSIANVDLSEGDPLTFEATVDVYPEIEVGDYKNLEVVFEESPFEEEEVDKYLEYIRSLHAQFDVVDREVREGDLVIVDLKEVSEDGTELSEPKRNQTVHMNRESLRTEIFDALLGKRVQDVADVTLSSTSPVEAEPSSESQTAGEGAGEEASQAGGSGEKEQVAEGEQGPDEETLEARIQLDVREVREKHLPEMDDEFAKSLRDFESLEDLRTSAREGLLQAREERDKEALSNRVLEQLLKENQFDVPDSVVDNLERGMLERAMGNERQQGREPEVSALREKIRPVARERARADFLLEEIALQEGIEADPEEVDKAVASLAQEEGLEPQQLRSRLEESGAMDGLRSSLRRRKTLYFLVDSARVVALQMK